MNSGDSNWSLNAALMNRDTMLNKRYPSNKGLKSMAEIGLSHWDKQVLILLLSIFGSDVGIVYVWY